MDRELVLYEDVNAEAQESQDELQDASSAPLSAKKALDELHAELSRVNADIRALGDLVEKVAKEPGVNLDDLVRFTGRVVNSTKKGALTALFGKANGAQIDMIADKIMANKDELAAFVEFSTYTEVSDMVIFRDASTMRAAIAAAFQKREDAKAAKANARSAPVVDKSEGERTGRGRGERGGRGGRGGHGDRGDASKSEVTDVKKSDRDHGHHKGGERGGRGGQRGGKSTRAALAALDKGPSGAS